MTTHQFNTRLPKLTIEQIDELSKELGLTKVQVLILAVDRLAQSPKGDKPKKKETKEA